ncbi:NADH dehydrogenase (ubiquinone) 1 alpha subcomplex assembly factor 5 [Azospirillaceae bacterium]
MVSSLSLHWVNDLPGALIQIRRCLKPDGLFLGAMLGGDTLSELRRSLMESELALTGGMAPRLSPFAELRDAGRLLQRAGFALPVADIETLTVTYADPFRLLADLRGMGETSALFAEPARRYAELYAEADGRIPATFQILWFAAWTPHHNQQRPLRRGSGKVPLSAALVPGEQNEKE